MLENEERYLKGSKNRLIRYYFYLTIGLDILNQFRNLFLGIFAVYITFKITSIPFLILVFIVSVIVLTVVGFYTIHYINKIKDFLSTKFGSHFGIQSFDYQKSSFELMTEIRDILKEKNGK